MKGRIGYAYTETPIGALEICYDDEGLYHLLFADELERKDTAAQDPECVTKATKQLKEYFEGSRKEFDLPLYIQGTDFQKSVWEELKKIPYADTVSYLQLAKSMGDPNSVRAVASANSKNLFMIVIPCHRVVGANGNLVGYAGGIPRKNWLLEHEQKCSGKTLSLF